VEALRVLKRRVSDVVYARYEPTSPSPPRTRLPLLDGGATDSPTNPVGTRRLAEQAALVTERAAQGGATKRLSASLRAQVSKLEELKRSLIPPAVTGALDVLSADGSRAR